MKIIETYRTGKNSVKLKTDGSFYFVRIKLGDLGNLFINEKYDDLDLALDRYYTFKEWIDEKEKKNGTK